MSDVVADKVFFIRLLKILKIKTNTNIDVSKAQRIDGAIFIH